MTVSETFWSTDTSFDGNLGLFHKADRDSAFFIPGVLLVFVHGINSSAKSCWEDIPIKLLHDLSVDVDVINFQYPVSMFSETSIPDVANLLHSLLIQWRQSLKYEDLIFLVHSAGGLVLKSMLISDAAAKKEILRRTRHIFNFGVPHAGAKAGLAELGRQALVFIGLITAPFAYLISFVLNGKINCGRNKFYIALKHGSSFLMRLEDKYRHIIQELDSVGHSRPESIDVDRITDPVDVTEIRGVADVVSSSGAHYRYSSDRDEITVRGSHSSIKSSPLSILAVKERIRMVIESLWSVRRAEYDQTVAHLLMQRCQMVNSTTGVTKLFGEKPGNSAGLDQETCLKQLETIIFNNIRVERIIVSGPVGVGKSVVLRTLCRIASEDFVKSGKDPFVLFFPIDRLRLDQTQSPNSPEGLWMSMCQAWVKHTNDLMKEAKIPAGLPTTITLSWLLKRLSGGKTVILLDGVDEFIANHPQIAIQQFTDCLPTEGEEVSTRDVRTVLAVRDAFWGLRTLSRNSIHLAMLPLGLEEVRQLIPGLADRIATMDAGDREILLTPLVVSALLKTHRVPQGESATKILQEAAESVLDSNKFYSEGLTLESLSLVAWIYYRRFQRELSIADIKKGADELLHDWQLHLDECSPDGQMSSMLSQCCENLKTILDSEKLRRLLRHSFFFRTTANAYSVSNEQWRDFLVTVYVSLCVRHKHAAGLAGVALQIEHYRRAGDLLADFQVDTELVSTFVSRGKDKSDPFIVGNLASLLGISQVSISPEASREMAQACSDDIHPLGRFVATGRLAGRAVRSNSPKSSDAYAVDLRAELSKVIPTILLRKDCANVMRSLCLCYQQAFGSQNTWQTELSMDEEFASWLWDRGAKDHEHSRSLQLSFLQPQFTAPLYPEHAVAHVHFLFLLTVARVSRLAIPEVYEHLPRLLEHGSATEAFYQSYSEVPQVLEIYRQCQRLWENFSSPIRTPAYSGDHSSCETTGAAR